MQETEVMKEFYSSEQTGERRFPEQFSTFKVNEIINNNDASHCEHQPNAVQTDYDSTFLSNIQPGSDSNCNPPLCPQDSVQVIHVGENDNIPLEVLSWRERFKKAG